MNEVVQDRRVYLEQLEQANPGYVAQDNGREIVLSPLSRVSEKERQAYEARMAAFVARQTVTIE